MRDWSWSLTRFMPLLSVFVALLIGAIAIIVVAAPTQSAGMAQSGITTLATSGPQPLPGGCIRTGPPGNTDTVCCINGYIYLDGKPIAGVKVTISTLNNRTVTVNTKSDPSGGLPYYQFDLTAAPLQVKVGDQILIRAEYGDYKKDLPQYTVKVNGQQVDIVLTQEQSSTYQFAQQLEPTPPDPFGFNQPNGVATDSSGNIYVLDKENARIVVFDAYHKFLRQWGRFGSGPGQFRSPSAIAIDQKQNYVYVADGDDHSITRLQKFSLSGIRLGQLDNQAIPAQPLPASIQGIVVDTDGNLYVSGDTEVRKFNFTGQLLSVLGSPGSGNGQLNQASGLALDNSGNLYVVDSGNQRIQTFSPNGSFIKSWGSLGNSDGQFFNPQGIALDRNNSVYVVDSGNQRLQKFDSNGAFIAKWGSQGDSLFGFKNPSAIAINNEDLYIADSGNHRIQPFTLNGDSKFPWGHLGEIACFFNPGVMTVNSQGVLRVANGYDGLHQNNRCMSQFQPDGTQQANWSIPSVYNNVTSDANDNVYGLLQLKDEYVVDKFDNAGHLLFSQHILNRLRDVNGFAVDGNGNIYIDGNNTTSGQDQIDILDSTTGTWKKTGAMNFADTIALAVDKANDLYVARHNHNVLRFDSNGTLKGTLANDSEESYILSIAVAANNHLFVVDTDGNYRLQELDETDHLVSGWNPRARSPHNSDIYTPTQIVVDNTDNLKRVYVIEKGGGDYFDDAILKVYQLATYVRPIATINHRSHIFSVPQSETLVLDGVGDVSDKTANITAYKWESDRNGVLGTNATLQIPANQLALGDHTITFTVQDSKGRSSAPVSLQISVIANVAPTPTPTSQTNWTMLLYLDGDYNDGQHLRGRFDQEIKNLQQMNNLPTNVNIAIQVDGPISGDTQRLVITHDQQGHVATTTSPMDEAAMDSPNALADFVKWGQGLFSNTRYYLAIADHGQAVRGINWDTTSDPDLGAYLSVKALGTALRTSGVKPIDVLHLDACSMNLLEVAYELKDVAAILISSQYLAWDYFSYRDYAANIGPTTQPTDLSRDIVKIYADQVERDGHPYTLSALNLGQIDEVIQALNDLINELQALRQSGQITNAVLHDIRQASQTFESDGDYLNTKNDLYVDLKSWVNNLQAKVTVGKVPTQIQKLRDILTGDNGLILYNRAKTNPFSDGSTVDLEQAYGLSIFYPPDLKNQVFKAYISDQLFSFTASSQWPNFLNGHTTLSPGVIISPVPGPATMLENSLKFQIFLPIVLR